MRAILSVTVREGYTVTSADQLLNANHELTKTVKELVA